MSREIFLSFNDGDKLIPLEKQIPHQFKLINQLLVESIKYDYKTSFNNCTNILKSETRSTIALYLRYDEELSNKLTNENGLCGYILSYQIMSIYRQNLNNHHNIYTVNGTSLVDHNMSQEKLIDDNDRETFKQYIIKCKWNCINSPRNYNYDNLDADECISSSDMVCSWLDDNYQLLCPHYYYPNKKDWFKSYWFKWFIDSYINITCFRLPNNDKYFKLIGINAFFAELFTYRQIFDIMDNSFKIMNSNMHYFCNIEEDVLMPKIDEALTNLLQNILREFRKERHNLIEKKVKSYTDENEKRFCHIQLYLDLNDLELFQDFYAIENNKFKIVVYPDPNIIIKNERLKILIDLFGYYYFIDDMRGIHDNYNNINNEISSIKFANINTDDSQLFSSKKQSNKSRKLVIEDSDSELETTTINASQKIKNNTKIIIESDSGSDSDGQPQNIKCKTPSYKRLKTFEKQINMDTNIYQDTKKYQEIDFNKLIADDLTINSDTKLIKRELLKIVDNTEFNIQYKKLIGEKVIFNESVLMGLGIPSIISYRKGDNTDYLKSQEFLKKYYYIQQDYVAHSY